MTIINYEINGKKIMFVNSNRNTRHGFAHDTTLFIDGLEMESATCHYINRTWECYAYQSVMKQAVYKLLEWATDREKTRFMNERGYKKLTAERRVAFQAILENNEYFRFLQKIMEALR